MTEAVGRRADALTQGWVWRDVVTPFLATRLLLTLVGVLSQALLPMAEPPFPWEASSQPLINAWARWDAYWYDSIARFGYFFEPGEQSSVAFFPLYPLLMRAGGAVFGGLDSQTLAVVGILISNLALVGALVLLVMLVRLDFDEETAARTAAYLLVFPTSLFLSAVYSDALFLVLAVGAFYAARTERWWLAGLIGAGASLTRPHGVLLVLPLAWELVASRRELWAMSQRRGVAGIRTLWSRGLDVARSGGVALALVPLGLLTYVGYLAWRFGEPLAASQAQLDWGRTLVLPWQAIGNWLNGATTLHGPNHSLVDLAFTVAIATLIAASWRVRPSYAIFSGSVLLAVLSTASISSFMRFGVTLFPIFIVLALIARDRPAFGRAYLVGATAVSCVFMALYSQWYWVA